jgi:hypothetical protein
MAVAVQQSFSGHETFPFRYPWLKKGFDAVRADGDVFLRDDATTTLGVGKNMVRSIRHWCLTAGVVEEGKDRQGALRHSNTTERSLDCPLTELGLIALRKSSPTFVAPSSSAPSR